MSFTHRIVDGYDLIDLHDSLDLYTVPELKDFCWSLLKKPETKRIMLVMEDLGYIDSSGLGMLTNLHFECKQQGIQLKLASLSPESAKIFSLTKMDLTFDINQ